MVKNAHLLTAGNAAVAARMDEIDNLSAMLAQLASVSDRRIASRAQALVARITEFSAKVTLVGQVKAGKSAMTNILSGTPNLLPSDVNPWTSVVTTLMINTRGTEEPVAGEETRARFTFFDRDEWDRLVVGGGRLGELAQRAGAPEDVERIQQQVIAMRMATEKRLGRHFEFLLGQSHSYGYYDSELIERYVCLGDDPDLGEVVGTSGRFADITKAAEIYMDVPQYRLPLQICDTPGVNDTFMMREQITIRSLRGSEICVVVLSAHQAMTTADMALIRIISAIEKRQIIIFVNRVDELADPLDQIPEIREGIERTLQENRVSPDVKLIFGSAKWAEAALVGSCDDLSDDSIAALDQLVGGSPHLEGKDSFEAIWEVSGFPALLDAIGERVSEGSAQRLYDRVSRSALNLTNEARATIVATEAREAGQEAVVTGADPVAAMEKIAVHYGQQIEALIAELQGDLNDRLEKAKAGFVKRATDSLISFVQANGENGTWSYDPAGLRVLLKAAYMNFSTSLKSRSGKLFDEAAKHCETVYANATGGVMEGFRIAPPPPPMVPPPVSVGKTIALDLNGSWWRTWWRKRRGVEAFAADYVKLIQAEVQSVIDDLGKGQAPLVLDSVRATFRSFMTEQQEAMVRLMQSGTQGASHDDKTMENRPSADVQLNVLGEILKGLDAQAA